MVDLYVCVAIIYIFLKTNEIICGSIELLIIFKIDLENDKIDFA